MPDRDVDLLLVDLFKAYYSARKNKRSANEALEFEVNFESNLLAIYQEIKQGVYQPYPSICFISFHPIAREVFAANFRDRVVHHLIHNYLYPIIDKQLILDTYSCRPGKGTSFGIKRLNYFIRSCSRNYQQECYILKLDIKNYFMSIDRPFLFQKVISAIQFHQKEVSWDFKLIVNLIHKTIFNDPTKNCLIKGHKRNWRFLPSGKSLFHAKKNKGLPIGNLTSQLFGNLYLNDFDHFVKRVLHCRYYGRYVDDLIFVHNNKDFLKSIIPLIRKYLKSKLMLELHPRKIYLQHFTKGVRFLGTFVKPYRVYIHHRTKTNFYLAVKRWNNTFAQNNNKLSLKELAKLTACFNSYLGILKHYRTYNLRRKILTTTLNPKLRKLLYISNDYTKVSIKDKSAFERKLKYYNN